MKSDKEAKNQMMKDMIFDMEDSCVLEHLNLKQCLLIADHLIRKGWRRNENHQDTV